MQYIDYICVGVCLLHFFVSFFQSIFSGKKIEKICNKCLQPVLRGEEHDCGSVLTSEQLELVVKLVESFKGEVNVK